jgi:hypothetical protein
MRHISARLAYFAQGDEKGVSACSAVKKVTSTTDFDVSDDYGMNSDSSSCSCSGNCFCPSTSPLLFHGDCNVEEDEEFDRAAFEIISFLGFE